MTTSAHSLPHPETTKPVRMIWPYAGLIGLIHVAALAALLPYCFTWSGVALCFLGIYIYGTLGINLGYHRLLTHQGMSTPKWFERMVTVLGICSMQDRPARWVAIHRMHHQHSDHVEDPHTPLVSFAWAHFGWIIRKNDSHQDVMDYEHYVRDLLRDRFFLQLEKNNICMMIYSAHALLYFLVGSAIGYATVGTSAGAMQLGVSWLVWGVLFRTVLVWHITWSVNSLAHVSGYRTYDTRDESRNNWFVALISNGEGWHNNHHADQRSASHGHKWWELDVTHWTICGLESLGIVKDVVRQTAATKPDATADTKVA